MSETLSIPDFKTISYSNSVFSIESNSLDIILEMDENGCALQNSLSSLQGDPFEGKRVPIHFQWNNETVCATIFCVQTVYSLKEDENITTHLVLRLTNIHSLANYADFESVSFFIPYVNCRHRQSATNCSNGWSLCKSEITFGGKKWAFKDAYNNGHGYPIPYEMSDDENQRCGTLIETETNQFSSFEEIRSHAFHLCTMFGFALGKTHMWLSAWGINETGVHFLAASGYDVNRANNINAIIYYGDDQHRCVLSPVDYVDEICNEFYENSQWWQITLNWILNENQAHTVELTKLVEFVLLDRITSKIFAIISSVALNVDLENYTSNSEIKDYIGKPLSTKINRINMKKLTSEERDFVVMCWAWANNPQYMTKIKSICAFAGLALTSKQEQQIKERNHLVHQGRIQLAINQVMKYATETTSLVRALTLASIGYNGYFAAYSERPAVTEVFPNAARIKLSNIKKLAESVFN